MDDGFNDGTARTGGGLLTKENAGWKTIPRFCLQLSARRQSSWMIR